MKKNLLVLLTFFLLAFNFNVKAQTTLETYTWADLGISFLAPNDLDIEINDSESFESLSEIMLLSLSNDSSNEYYSSMDDLEVVAKFMAVDMGFSNNGTATRQVVSLGDFDALVLKGQVDEDDVVLAMLATEDFKTVFILTILYSAEDSEEIVNEIITSFKLN